jgi:hypothetical protein
MSYLIFCSPVNYNSQKCKSRTFQFYCLYPSPIFLIGNCLKQTLLPANRNDLEGLCAQNYTSVSKEKEKNRLRMQKTFRRRRRWLFYCNLLMLLEACVESVLVKHETIFCTRWHPPPEFSVNVPRADHAHSQSNYIFCLWGKLRPGLAVICYALLQTEDWWACLLGWRCCMLALVWAELIAQFVCAAWCMQIAILAGS